MASIAKACRSGITTSGRSSPSSIPKRRSAVLSASPSSSGFRNPTATPFNVHPKSKRGSGRTMTYPSEGSEPDLAARCIIRAFDDGIFLIKPSDHPCQIQGTNHQAELQVVQCLMPNPSNPFRNPPSGILIRAEISLGTSPHWRNGQAPSKRQQGALLEYEKGEDRQFALTA
ncbi:hypothetical protein ACLOJK_004562 [Asimina triloba]